MRQSCLTGARSDFSATIIVNTYTRALGNRITNIWRELNSEESQRLEDTIINIYGESNVQVYTRGSYRADQQFNRGRTATLHPYWVSFFTVTSSLTSGLVGVDVIEAINVPFSDMGTLIETVGLRNLGLVRISLSYDVFLEDDFDMELETTRIRMVLYEFLSEIQNQVTEEITFEFFHDSRIEFINEEGRVVGRFLTFGSFVDHGSIEFTLNELDDFDFTSFFIDVN